MSSNTMIAERNFVSPFRTATNTQKKPRTPYGLPIEGNCDTYHDRNANYFCGFSESSTRALEQIKRVTSYPQGAVLFMEGEASRGVYILCQGRVKLLTTNSDGKSLPARLMKLPRKHCSPARWPTSAAKIFCDSSRNMATPVCTSQRT